MIRGARLCEPQRIENQTSGTILRPTNNELAVRNSPSPPIAREQIYSFAQTLFRE
jgi:hypothetical protein